MLYRIPKSVQADEIVVGILDDMLHKQNLGPLGGRMIFTAARWVIQSCYTCLIEGEFIQVVAVMTSLLQTREGLPTRLKTRFHNHSTAQ